MKNLLNKAATLAGTTVGIIQINTFEMKKHYLNAKKGETEAMRKEQTISNYAKQAIEEIKERL